MDYTHHFFGKDYFNCSPVRKRTNMCPSAVDLFSPIKSFRLHSTDKPWISTRIKVAIKKRQKYLADCGKDSFLFKKWRNVVQGLIAVFRKAFYSATIKSLKNSNLGLWWKAVN